MPSNGYHDKIRKILAMLEGAKTEGEAKAANLALQRLLAKSNLTAEQVGALGSEDPSASIEEEPVYIGSNDVVWKRMLASAIAENLRCRVMLTAFPDKPRAKIIVFVGHAEDAALRSQAPQQHPKAEDNGQRRADSGQWPYRRLQLRYRPHLRLITPGFPLSHNPTRGEL